MPSKRKIHTMRAGHKVTLCGKWPSDKCVAVEIHQVQDWADSKYCGHCATARLRTADLEALQKAKEAGCPIGAGAPRYLLAGKRTGEDLSLVGTAHSWEQAMEGAFIFLDECPEGVLVIDINEQKSRLVKSKNPLFDRKGL